jgi:hypothetical protein
MRLQQVHLIRLLSINVSGSTEYGVLTLTVKCILLSSICLSHESKYSKKKKKRSQISTKTPSHDFILSAPSAPHNVPLLLSPSKSITIKLSTPYNEHPAAPKPGLPGGPTFNRHLGKS